MQTYPTARPTRSPSPADVSQAAALTVLLVVPRADVHRYPTAAATVVTAHTTAEGVQALDHLRPAVVVIDWDVENIDGDVISRAAIRRPQTTVMITTQHVERVPAALKSGCHAVLLKPFTTNLAAARLGRLCRDALTRRSPAMRAVIEQGTNRSWPQTQCPQCATSGAVGFDFASHRTSWYACVACDHVWRGPRQE